MQLSGFISANSSMVWPFFHKSFEEYYCGLFVARLGSELYSEASLASLSDASSQPTGSCTDSVYTSLLRHLLSESRSQSGVIRDFFFGPLRSTYWAAVLEFAACQGGASWLLSIYRPKLYARISLSSKSLQSAAETAAADAATLQPQPSAASATSTRLSAKDERVFFSRDGVLLVMCALDSAEATRQETVEMLTDLAQIEGVRNTISSTDFYGTDDASSNAYLHCAAQNRADYLALLLQLFPDTPRV
jgi:hypothetical protein